MATLTLPLFTLSEVVLFPGMVLPLHVFEERYIRMIQERLKGDRQFGVVLIESGEEVGEAAEPRPVGTIAAIQECRQIDQDGFVLLGLGRQRFRIRRHWADDQLVEAEVETFDDEPADPAVLGPLVERVKDQALHHLRLVTQAMGQTFEPPTLPEDPVSLSFLLAASVQSGLDERMQLLASTDTAARLATLSAMLANQATILEHRLAIRDQAGKVLGTNGRLSHDHLNQDVLDRL